MGAAAAGMACANSGLAGWYDQWLATEVEVRIGESGLRKPLLLWINDGLMALFFLLVGLELKREVLRGELSSRSQIALPLAAAIAGIAVPALVFYGFTHGDPDAARGWAIPAATDIAFALGILALVGDRVPPALKTFLLSLAVFDDLGAILIIAAFYTDEISWTAKGMAIGFSAALLILNRLRVRRVAAYMLVGAALWLCVLKSGMHATLAGVIVGLAIPLRVEAPFGGSPLEHLEHGLHPWIAFLVVPLFAFANAGVSLTGVHVESLLDPVAVGIAVGLVIGKPVAVFATVMLMARLGVARLPAGATPLSMLGVSFVAGIGFTMSLFIGTLAYEHTGDLHTVAVRLGVLGGSLVSALVGFLLLRAAVR